MATLLLELADAADKEQKSSFEAFLKMPWASSGQGPS
eukprot:SAG11_NODE_34845_length_269_cov_5.000000_1_plen_36_part_10